MWVRFNQDDGENHKNDVVDIQDPNRLEDIISRKVAGKLVSPHSQMAYEEAPTEVVIAIEEKYQRENAIDGEIIE